MYLLGALHDATYNKQHKTIRFSQSSEEWLRLLKSLLLRLERKSWIYREGKDRSVFVLETSIKIDQAKKPTSDLEKVAYIRGYFDTDGGMPKNDNHFLYLQFCQKDREDLSEVKKWLEDLGIKCGVIHNPSKKADANYWRFFISRIAHQKFIKMIGSWHPRKSRLMRLRMKI
jgi:hypothetical protein